MRTTYKRIKPEEAVGFPLLKQIATDKCILSIYTNGFTLVTSVCHDLDYEKYDLLDNIHDLTEATESCNLEDAFERKVGYKLVVEPDYALEVIHSNTLTANFVSITNEQILEYNDLITYGNMTQAQALMEMILNGSITVKDARGIAWLSLPTVKFNKLEQQQNWPSKDVALSLIELSTNGDTQGHIGNCVVDDNWEINDKQILD